MAKIRSLFKKTSGSISGAASSMFKRSSKRTGRAAAKKARDAAAKKARDAAAKKARKATILNHLYTHHHHQILGTQ